MSYQEIWTILTDKQEEILKTTKMITIQGEGEEAKTRPVWVDEELIGAIKYKQLIKRKWRNEKSEKTKKELRRAWKKQKKR